MRSVADSPAFADAHWFQSVDEPLTGRELDGESYNISFVTVTPYTEMVRAARSALREAYARRSSPRRQRRPSPVKGG